MTHPDDYQAFVQQILRDTAQLDKQYKAFEELKKTLEHLKVSAAHDPQAARSLANINALHSDVNFQQLCSEAESDLRTISQQIDKLNKQYSQAENTQSAPVPEIRPTVTNSAPAVSKQRKRRKPLFV